MDIKGIGESQPVSEPSAVPSKPRRCKNQAQYWEDNKEAILKDYHSMKLLDFLKKWHMSTKTWTELKKLWEVKGKGKSKTKRTPVATSTDTRAVKDRRSISLETYIALQGKGLPAFPEFNDSWPELVQLHWLDTYRELAGGKR